MISELMIGGVLYAAGLGALAPLSRRLGNTPWVWLSLPMGAALYLVIVPILILVTGTLEPSLALVVAAAVGGIGAAVAAYMRLWGRRFVLWALLGLGIAVATVVLSRLVHLTRLTPDSFRYLTVAANLVHPEALSEVNSGELLRRHIGLPSLQALHELVDRRYMASIAPLFGVFGFGLFGWLTWHHTVTVPRRRRLLLVSAAGLLLLASNRLLYDAFYINSHIQIAVYLLIAVSGPWLAVRTGRSEWAGPGGVALAVALLFRPEMALVAAVLLVAVSASRANWTVRSLMVVPSAAVGAVWYGIILWRHGAGGNELTLTSPVFGSLVMLAGSIAVVLLLGLPPLRGLARYADALMLGVMTMALLTLGWLDPDIMGKTVAATFRNLTYDGLWLFTWAAVILLLPVALAVQRIPDGRLWTTPLLGFALIFWTLPFIRGSAWRVGEGDSGNRILAHFLAIVVAFLVLAAVNWPEEAKKPTQPSPAR